MAALLAACGDNAGVDFGAPSSTFPDEMPPIPQVVSHGGSVMSDVHVVPVYFGSDDEQPQLDDFLAKYAASPYWAQMTAEYGVTGPLTIEPDLVTTHAVPTDGDSLTTFVHDLFGSIDTDTLSHTIYLLHFAEAQQFDGGNGSLSCQTFAGFHTAVGQTGDKTAPQVVLALTWSCTPINQLLEPLDEATIVHTHEIVEATTDPLPSSGFSTTDPASVEWELHFGGEVGDMCEGFPRRIYRPDDVGYFIQRTWSNTQMMGFHDPCVPLVPDEGPFFATVPVEDDVDNGVRANNIELNTSRTIDLLFLSDAETDGEWIVEPIDDSTIDGNPPVLLFDLDRNVGKNGERAHLTITPSPDATKGVVPYRLLSTLGSRQLVWFGAVDLGRAPGAK